MTESKSNELEINANDESNNNINLGSNVVERVDYKNNNIAIGYVAGLPTGQASSSIEFLADVLEGTQQPENVSDWWAGVHTGDMTKQ